MSLNASSDAAGIDEICWSCCNIFNKFVFAHFTNLLQAVADSYFAIPVYTLRPYSSNSCNSFNKFLSSCKNCKPLSASFTQKKKKSQERGDFKANLKTKCWFVKTERFCEMGFDS